MIAHVAEASEASGRVLLWLDPDTVAMPQTFDASVRIAGAYAANLETVIIDRPGVYTTDGIPSAHVSLLGKLKAPMKMAGPGSPDATDIRMYLAERQRRDVATRAARANVIVSHSSARGDAIDRLAEMCLERGPWNIVAVSRPPSSELPGILSSILANVSGATGVVVAGRGERTHKPDVVVIIEDAERMPSMLRAAERLLLPGGKIHAMIAAETASCYQELDAQVRLVAREFGNIVHHPGRPDFGITGTMDEDLFRLQARFVVARFGGNLLGDAKALMRLLSVAPGPMLLVR
jgi:hypothetical protein